MTGAIEFLRKAKAICDSRDTCTNCPVDDLCILYGIYALPDALNDTVQSGTDCNIIRSRLESSDEVCETGEWEA